MKVQFLAGSAKASVRNLASIAVNARGADVSAMSFLKFNTEQGTVTATNQVLTVVHKLEMDTKDKGEFLIEANKLSTLLGMLDDDAKVTIEKDGSVFLLKAGRSRYKLSTLDPESFPSMDKPTSLKGFTLLSEHFVKATDACVSFVDSSRPFLSGVFFEAVNDGFKVTSSNGIVLSHACFDRVDVDNEEDVASAFLPQEFMKVASSLAKNSTKCKLFIADEKVAFVGSGVTVWSKVVGHKFADYMKVLNNGDYSTELEPNVSAWQKSIGRIKPMVDSVSKEGVVLQGDNGVLSMTVESGAGDSVEVVEAVMFEHENPIRLNINYLDKMLKIFGDKVKLMLPKKDGGQMEFVEQSAGYKLKQVLMPMIR